MSCTCVLAKRTNSRNHEENARGRRDGGTRRGRQIWKGSRRSSLRGSGLELSLRRRQFWGAGGESSKWGKSRRGRQPAVGKRLSDFANSRRGREGPSWRAGREEGGLPRGSSWAVWVYPKWGREATRMFRAGTRCKRRFWLLRR